MPKGKNSQKSKPENKKVTENLRKIYENDDGSMPDMKYFEHVQRHWLRRIFSTFLTLATVVALGFAAWHWFMPRFSYQDDVTIDIEGAAVVAPGDSATYTVRYRNPGTMPVAEAAISFQYPRGWQLATSSSAILGDRNTITLGSLPAGATGTVVMTGNWLTDFNTTSTMTVVLDYKPANFNSRFQKIARLIVVSSNPAVTFLANDLSFAINPILPITQPIVVSMESDSLFTLDSAEPKPDEPGILHWTLPSLTSVKKFNLQGSFSEKKSSRLTVTVSGKSFVYGQATFEVIAPTSTKNATVTVLGKNDKAVIRPGENLPIIFSGRDLIDKKFTNLSLVLYVEAPSYERKSILDWQNLIDDRNGVVRGEQISDQTRRGIITWETDNLNSDFDIIVPIKSSATASLVNFGTNIITIWGEVRDGNTVIATTNQVTVTILSDLALSVSAKSTGLANDFSFLLTNSFHDLKNVTIKTTLNGVVVWDQEKLSVLAGSVVFTSGVNEVLWSIKEMPTNLDSLNLEFGVNVAKQNSTQTYYTGPVVVNATDTETNEPISFTIDPIKVN